MEDSNDKHLITIDISEDFLVNFEDEYNKEGVKLLDEKNYREAFKSFKKSADAGYACGKCNVGWCYQNGFGVEKDENRAFEYYQMSVNMGYNKAKCYIGYCYYKGIGVKKNKHQAFIHYKGSADMGCAKGAYNTGYFYEEGIGVEKDYQQAFIYYKKSADMDCHEGVFSVGSCYEKGIGVKLDKYRCFYYYSKSGHLGYENGKKEAEKFYNNELDETIKDYYKYCLVLEYANNGNLRNYLQANKLDWKEKKRIATEISLGLLFLHKNEIIHRDFNIIMWMISNNGIHLNNKFIFCLYGIGS
ncbi:hypothetical protein C2G38_2141818 [Gigaspora rosea]|uniref:Protein kinase domain-containing protein n=1 Tax=Gigaspora rosea TaxID=44941 RepID=A0A397VGL8_9GLOM|nr:hypothetical protein C2G38_2141818 [Gigaspora rosea]